MFHNYLKQINLCQTFGQVHVIWEQEEDLWEAELNAQPAQAHALTSDFRASGPEAVWERKK